MVGCGWPVTRSSLHWCYEPAQQSDPGIPEPHALCPCLGEHAQEISLKGVPCRPTITEGPMELLYHRCAALDVHKASVAACRVRTLPNGQKEQEIRSFGTTTPELLRLLDWLQEWGVT